MVLSPTVFKTRQERVVKKNTWFHLRHFPAISSYGWLLASLGCEWLMIVKSHLPAPRTSHIVSHSFLHSIHVHSNFKFKISCTCIKIMCMCRSDIRTTTTDTSLVVQLLTKKILKPTIFIINLWKSFYDLLRIWRVKSGTFQTSWELLLVIAKNPQM